MKQKNNEEIIKRINKYQSNRKYKPMVCTCTYPKKRMIPFITEDNKVALTCDSCGFIQHFIPQCFLKDDLWEELQREIFKGDL